MLDNSEDKTEMTKIKRNKWMDLRNTQEVLQYAMGNKIMSKKAIIPRIKNEIQIIYNIPLRTS